MPSSKIISSNVHVISQFMTLNLGHIAKPVRKFAFHPIKLKNWIKISQKEIICLKKALSRFCNFFLSCEV